MAQSLAPECSSLKLKYDSCFNTWFEGYLEPAITTKDEDRKKYAKEQAAEFDRKCGVVWVSYRACVEKAMDKSGLTQLLDRAREESNG